MIGTKTYKPDSLRVTKIKDSINKRIDQFPIILYIMWVYHSTQRWKERWNHLHFWPIKLGVRHSWSNPKAFKSHLNKHEHEHHLSPITDNNELIWIIKTTTSHTIAQFWDQISKKKKKRTVVSPSFVPDLSHRR